MARRVLIVDDEENIRQMTRLALETAGYEVGEAASGLELPAICRLEKPFGQNKQNASSPISYGMIGTSRQMGG